MSYRFMRVIVMFDLPSTSLEEMREYRKFRGYLIKTGFMMAQESIYSKLALNSTTANSLAENLRKNKPKWGLVQLLVITEKQYNSMEFLIGQKHSELIDSDERLVVL